MEQLARKPVLPIGHHDQDWQVWAFSTKPFDVTLGVLCGDAGMLGVHLRVADIAWEPTHPQKRCVPTLHREPQKWEATIPVYKANRKVNEINGLPRPPPRQC